MSIFLKGWNGGVLMKRFFALVVGLCVFILSRAAFANYPTYLNGDRNLILCDGHMGVAWYVDRTSLVVQKYEPPQYIIAVNVVTADSAVGDERDFYSGGKGRIKEVRTMRFFYNWDLRKMYVGKGGADDWRFIPPTGSWAETGISMPAGEIAFALAYNMRFYGSMPFYDKFLKREVMVFNDDFYARIP